MNLGGKTLGGGEMSLHKPSGLSLNDPSSAAAVLAMQQQQHQQEMTIGSKPTSVASYQTNTAAQPNDLGNSNKVGRGLLQVFIYSCICLMLLQGSTQERSKCSHN